MCMLFCVGWIMFNLSTGIPVMYCLLEVVSICPEKLAPRFVGKIDWIKVSVLFICVYLDVGRRPLCLTFKHTLSCPVIL